VSDDRIEGDIGDILDAIIAEGSCKACGTPWAFVVKMDGKRPVKIEGGCPNEVRGLGVLPTDLVDAEIPQMK
jgi:hypothetical protein